MTTTITPRAVAKYAEGQEVYWGARLCTIHDVNTTGDTASYLVSLESLEGGTRVADRPVYERELTAVRPAGPDGIRTRIVTPCAQTCTTSKCYYEPNGRPDCPLC